MLFIWRDFRGVIYYELLPPGRTITAEVYCAHLANSKTARKKSVPIRLIGRGSFFIIIMPDLMFPCQFTACMEYGLDVIVHPPYFPDLAPLEFHLFRSFQNSTGETEFRSADDMKSFFDNFLASKPASFYEIGILQLPERWQKVVN